MIFLLPLFYFMMFNASIVCFSKRKFGECLPISLMVTAFTLFISQFIFKTFNVGFYLNILIALSSIILLIFEYKKDKLKEFKSNYLTKGLVAFIVVFIFVYIYDFNRNFHSWDEFSHWGEMVKEMFRLDKFYTVNQSVLLAHKDYPPILQLYELFWCKLCNGFSEPLITKSLHIFELSLFIPAIAESKKIKVFESAAKSIFIILIIFLTILFFDGHGVINTIYNDYFMAILLAYIIFSIVTSKNSLKTFDLFKISIASSFLLLTKQIGLPLYLMIIFTFVFNLLINYFEKRKLIKKEILSLFNKKYIFKYLKILIFIIIIPMLFYKLWSIYISNYDVYMQFNLSTFKISDLINILKGNGLDYQIKTLYNYKQALGGYNITTSYIKLSYIQCFVLIIPLIYIVGTYGKKYISKNKTYLLMISTFLGYIGYAAVMLILYLMFFGSIEGPALASFNRYMPTYILAVIFIALMLWIYIDSKKDVERKKINFKSIIIIFICLFLIQSPNQITKLYPKFSKDYREPYKMQADIIKKHTKKLDKIYILDEKNIYEFFLNYYISPRIVNNYSTSLETNFPDRLKKYDYLFTATYDDKFEDNYKDLFDKLEKNSIYKINREDGIITFTKLNK